MARPFELRTVDELREPIWDQQVNIGETDSLYVMFLAFANLKPSERTIANAWREWTKDTSRARKSMSSTFRQISTAWLWQERAASRDINMLQERYKKWGERDWDLRESDYVIAEKIRGKLDDALSKLGKDDIILGLGDILGMLQTTSGIQRTAIPQLGNLSGTQITNLISSLPDGKRDSVLRIVAAEYRTSDSNSTDNSTIISTVNDIVDSTDDIIDGEIKLLENVPVKKPSKKSKN